MDSSFRTRALTLVGGAIVALLSAFPVRSVSTTASDALLLLTVLLFVGGLTVSLKGLHSRYDLKGLREYHELEADRKADVAESHEFDSVYCTGCGEAYDIRLPVCPRCRAR